MCLRTIQLLILLAFLTQNGWSQHWIMVRGSVYDIKGKPLAGANVRNVKRLYGAFSDSGGEFVLILATADTLEVSMVGFKPFRKEIPRQLTALNYSLNITLLPDTILLKVAEIIPYPLTYQALRQEFIATPSVEEQYFSRLEIPPTVGPLIIGGPISFLYNKYSKEARELRKMEVIYANISMRNRFLRIISPETLSIRYGCYSEEDIDDLLRFCGISAHWFNSMSNMQLAERIKTCGEAWKEDQLKKSP